MATSPQMFENEQYSCKVCNTKLTEKEINDEWQCVHCNNRVVITVGKKVFVRKLPHEIEKGEDILLRATEKFHEVLFVYDTDPFEFSCSVNLEEYRNRIFKDEWLNVILKNNYIVY